MKLIWVSPCNKTFIIWKNFHHCPLCSLHICWLIFFSMSLLIPVSGCIVYLPNPHSDFVRFLDMWLSDTTHLIQEASHHLIVSCTSSGTLMKSSRWIEQGWLIKLHASSSISRPRLEDLASSEDMATLAHELMSSHVTGLPVSSLCFSTELLGFHAGQDVALQSAPFPSERCQTNIIVWVCVCVN